MTTFSGPRLRLDWQAFVALALPELLLTFAFVIGIGHCTIMNYRALAAVVLGTAIGLPAGIGCYTFVYARGYSYLTNDPAACANCHVMQGHYDAWIKSSHRNVATCNDCHLPTGIVGKYMTKASNGYHHSLAFTTGKFHEPIQIKRGNERVTEDCCRKCHGEIVDAIEGTYPQNDAKRLSCVRCHDSVGHMR